MNRLTARTEKGLAYLVNVKPDEQAVDSPHKNTLQCILDCFERLAHYEDLEEQGRLLVLPCKVGDTVCWADEDGREVHELPLMGYWVTVFSSGVKQIDGCVQAFGRNWSKPFGACLFLTRAEAEAALRKLDGGGQDARKGDSDER